MDSVKYVMDCQPLQERVRDVLVDKGKLPLVVHELLLIEVWRQEILPRILQRGPPSTIFQLYMTLFHECNLVNLLETVLFSGPACHSLEAAAVDLTDYCVRQVTDLITSTDPDEGGVDHAKRELGDHLNNLRFQVKLAQDSVNRLSTFKVPVHTYALHTQISGYIVSHEILVDPSLLE